jgi:predicted trehalose synthase
MTETLRHVIAMTAAWELGREDGWTAALDAVDQESESEREAREGLATAMELLR